MQMPGRTYQASSSSSYRYSFNGKEDDKDINGGAQDYGMRIYDKRLVKFLSTDPLTRNFPFYTPYQFAGNSPIKYIDLDGKEPQDYMCNWQYQTLYANGKQRVGDYIIVSDSKLKNIDAVMVYDKVTNKNWFVHQDDQGNWFYLKNKTGDNGTMDINRKTNDVLGGQFVPFETQGKFQGKLTGQLANAIEGVVVATITAPFAYAGMVATGGGGLLSFAAPESGSIAATRILSGAGSDILAQKTINENASINWWSVGANGLGGLVGANVWTTAAVASSASFKNGKLETVKLSEFAVNTIANGAAGALAAKGPWEPGKFSALKDKAASTLLGGVPAYVAGTAAGAASEATNNSSSIEKKDTPNE